MVQRGLSGLSGVVYAVSDEHEGLVQALRRYFPDAAHQRCQVHYLRNALAKVTRPALEQQLLTGLRNVWAAPTREEANERAQALLAALRPTAPKVVE